MSQPPQKNQPHSKQEKIAFIAAVSSGIELIVGSFLHGFKLPFGGHTLSLVQIGFLSYSVSLAKNRLEAVKFPIYISSISSCLKSLSPAGNKLGPMMSIWMQGFLFSLGPALFSRSKFGLALGAVLASLWAFVQPILTLYLFFGGMMFDAAEFYLGKLNKHFSISLDQVWSFLMIVVGVKVLLAIAVSAFIVPYFSSSIFGWTEKIYSKQQKIVSQTIQKRQNSSEKNLWLLALKDLCQPFFLLSFLLGAVFFIYSFGDQAKIIWLSLRPIGVAYLFFVLSRSALFAKGIQRLRQVKFFDHFFATFDLTLGFLIRDQSLEVDHLLKKQQKNPQDSQ